MHTPQGKEWLDLDLNIAKGEFITFLGNPVPVKQLF
jgi:ABC-type Fe3+/spermidine/putrescine transport system ATPase subunit